MADTKCNNIVILGSTGSIGRQSLEVISQSSDMKVLGLSANVNIDLLEKQARKFLPKVVCVADPTRASDLKVRLSDTDIKVFGGFESVVQLTSHKDANTIINALVGVAGLLPTISAIMAKKNVALANKETMVAAGGFITELANEYGVSIIPIDSEHSAVFQCLEGVSNKTELNRIILTASGGPFLGKSKNELVNVTPEQALKHPNWNMGRRISIDSATLVNKGLEIIEAKWFFDVLPTQIDVLIHPESIVHSMVEFNDGAIMAQLGIADMKIPIAYALTYPNRIIKPEKRLNLAEIKTLNFIEADKNTFKSLDLAYNALNTGKTAPAVFNAADEAAVELFLNKKISFLDIIKLVEDALLAHTPKEPFDINSVFEADLWAREYVYRLAV